MRNWLRFATVCCLLLFTAFTAKSQRGVTVKGQAVDPTGAALQSTSVLLVSTDDIRRATTDKDGRFEFQDVPPATYAVDANVRGFARKILRDIVVADKEVQSIQIILSVRTYSGPCVYSVDSADRPRVLTYVSYEKGSGEFNVTGRAVRSMAGSPVRNAKVSLSQAGQAQPDRVATTDENGEFRFAAVEPGEYRLSAGQNELSGATERFWVTRRSQTKVSLALSKLPLC